MTDTSSLVGSPLTQRLNAASLWLILAVAAAGALIRLAFGVFAIAHDLTTRSATLNLVANKPLPAVEYGAKLQKDTEGLV